MAVHEYVGARYVPKFSDVNGGDWSSSYTYEALTIVKNGNDYYTSRVPVPTGVDISNTDYWVLTGNYNGAISNLQDQIDEINTRMRFNIADYGMEPGDNIYDDLFDLLHNEVAPAGGGVVHFPAGTYYLDYSIVIPDNTVFEGEGDQTDLVFTMDDLYIGCAVVTGGSNIVIRDMSVNTNTTSQYDIRGSLPNCIGIGDYDFTQMTTKRDHNIYTKSGNHNIVISNVHCRNSNYGIQIEPRDYKVSDVFIMNHECPQGMFSMQPASDSLMIENVFAYNIICDTLRYGTGMKGCRNINVNGLYCTQLNAESGNTHVSNFFVYSSAGNRVNTATHYAMAINLAHKGIMLSNGHITQDASSPHTYLFNLQGSATYQGEMMLDNITVDSGATFTNRNTYSWIWSNGLCNVPNLYPSLGLENYVGNISSSGAPASLNFDMNVGNSWVRALCAYDGTNNFAIAKINTVFEGSPIDRAVSGVGIAYNYTDPTVPAIPVMVVLDPSDHIIKTKRIGTNTYTYNALLFDLTW